MPVKKQNKQSQKSVEKPKVQSFEAETTVKTEETSCCLPKNKIFKKPLILLVSLVLVFGILGYFFKDKLLVAIVDGKPIFRSQLNKVLVSTYGKEVSENLILENLIKTEAEKQQVNISDEEVNAEIDKIKANLGDSITIEAALSQQGMTLADFKEQLKTKLQIYKILGKDVTVSKEEIDQLVKQEPSVLVATAEAEKRVEAESTLKEQKINSKIQTWISDLLAKAKITRFLK